MRAAMEFLIATWHGWPFLFVVFWIGLLVASLFVSATERISRPEEVEQDDIKAEAAHWRELDLFASETEAGDVTSVVVLPDYPVIQQVSAHGYVLHRGGKVEKVH